MTKNIIKGTISARFKPCKSFISYQGKVTGGNHWNLNIISMKNLKVDLSGVSHHARRCAAIPAIEKELMGKIANDDGE